MPGIHFEVSCSWCVSFLNLSLEPLEEPTLYSAPALICIHGRSHVELLLADCLVVVTVVVVPETLCPISDQDPGIIINIRRKGPKSSARIQP